ncbi:MAG: DUF4180 domain-containing protein [Oscillospiraceae bacterium]
MKLELVGQNNCIALVVSDECVITDGQSVLDLIATVSYETNADRLILDKSAITEDFFKLSTGVAGEVLQKCVNYHVKMAIVGDFSRYTSKPLKDFIYESNRGKDFFFVGTVDEAAERLGG